MLLEQLPVVELKVPGAQSFEDLVGVRESWLVVFHQTTDILEDVTLPVQDGSHPRVNRQPAEVAAPGHPRTREVSLQGPKKSSSGPELARGERGSGPEITP